MVFEGGGNELRGSVAVIDGKFFPVVSFEVTVDRNVETAGFANSVQTQQFTTGESVYGSMQTYRALENISVKPTMFFFSRQDGTAKRPRLTGVIFAQMSQEGDLYNVTFTADDVEYS